MCCYLTQSRGAKLSWAEGSLIIYQLTVLETLPACWVSGSPPKYDTPQLHSQETSQQQKSDVITRSIALLSTQLPGIDLTENREKEMTHIVREAGMGCSGLCYGDVVATEELRGCYIHLKKDAGLVPTDEQGGRFNNLGRRSLCMGKSSCSK